MVEITRKLTIGTGEKAKELLCLAKGCMEFNTAFIERLNGTFRERLASLTRKCRHAAVRVATLEEGIYLIGYIYNFYFAYKEISEKTHFGYPTTPEMAADLKDHIWSIQEVLWYKVVPAPSFQTLQSSRNDRESVRENRSSLTGSTKTIKRPPS